MKLNPPKGMRDILIKETSLRNSVLSTITRFYKNAGFFQISTPIIEDKENISKSDGGDNLNLVFEIMKRSESLQDAIANGKELSDMALRYDLTLPLSRCYAANKDVLPNPFKVIQTGLVYRAERPQKGRLREFRQCDIDILGDETTNAEIELFCTSLGVLKALGFEGLTLKINDRRLLYSLLSSFGFENEAIPSVCITFDKMDKIGISGVEVELKEKGFASKSITSLLRFIEFLSSTKDSDKIIQYIKKELSDTKILDDLSRVSSSIAPLIDKSYKVEFSPSLVRGQGYYTGIVAEAYSSEFGSAIAAGGRYDNLIGKFTGKNTPAVGFSIGFERIMSILLEKSIDFDKKDKVALVYSDADDFSKVMKKKLELMKNSAVSVFQEPKNKKKFYTDLDNLGFFKVVNFATGDEKLLGGAK